MIQDNAWLWIFLIALVPLTEAFGRRLRLPLWIRIVITASIAAVFAGVVIWEFA